MLADFFTAAGGKCLTRFEENALRSLARELLNVHADRAVLASRAEQVAALVRCTPSELFVYMQMFLSGLQTLPRVQGFFGEPLIDQDAARESDEQEMSGAATCRLSF